MSDLAARRILIGVSGGIAAYKAAMLVSRLRQQGADVTVLMTAAARHMVTEKTFEALSGREVFWKMFGRNAHPHIEIAQRCELFCIAPTTANLLAKMAHGIADDLMSTTVLAFPGPILIAPAMNVVMWNKPAVQRNIQQLRTDGIEIIDPAEGYLSCGMKGEGRMAEPETILSAIRTRLTTLSC